MTLRVTSHPKRASKKSIRHTTLYVTQDIGRHPRMKYQVFRESHVNIVIFSYCNYSSLDLYSNAQKLLNPHMSNSAIHLKLSLMKPFSSSSLMWMRKYMCICIKTKDGIIFFILHAHMQGNIHALTHTASLFATFLSHTHYCWS